MGRVSTCKKNYISIDLRSAQVNKVVEFKFWSHSIQAKSVYTWNDFVAK